MRLKVAHGDQPWLVSWQKLIANRHASLNWKHNPQATVYRGANGYHAEDFVALFNDAAAACALALGWKISGDNAYAEKAVEILNASSSSLPAIDGISDKFLASGIYGYQLENAAEFLRNYPDWRPADFDRFKIRQILRR